MPKSITERVEAGAAWLDEEQPGWIDLINLELLDNAHCNHDIVGQVSGDNRDIFLDHYCLGTQDQIEYGFDSMYTSEGLRDWEFGKLDEAWTGLIAKRQEA